MKLNLVLSVFFSFALIPQVFPMALNFDKRRFAQEHTTKAEATYAAVRNISLGTGKEQQAGDLSGAMVRALLAKAPTCDQQDRADEIIDLAIKIRGDKKEKLIQVAKTYRQLERNTPKVGLPSKLCKKKPRHKELDGLVQAQDPTGGKGKDPDPPPKPKDPKKHEKPKADPVKTKHKKPKADPVKTKHKKPKADPVKTKHKKPKADPVKTKHKKPKADPVKTKHEKPKADPVKTKHKPKADPVQTVYDDDDLKITMIIETKKVNIIEKIINFINT